MKYSIVVSVYRVEEYLVQCIESILAQTYRDFELILVDDGSPDGCPQICDEYAKRNNIIKVIHKENGGLMSTRKAGVSVATGEYICFIDGDDFIASDMLDVFEKALCGEAVDIISAGYSAYYSEECVAQKKQMIPQGIYHKKELVRMIYPKMLSADPFFTFLIFPSVCTKCFKRNIAERIYEAMPENISLGEDAAATYPALLLAESLCVLDYHGYMYRQNPESMTRSYDKNLYQRVRNLLIHLRKIQKELSWDAGNQIEEYTVFLLYLAKNNEFKYNKTDSYRNKKRNMNQYLYDPIFRDSLAKVKVDGFINKFLLFCFRHCFMLPIHLYEKIMKKGK